jgi:hypothetical protein
VLFSSGLPFSGLRAEAISSRQCEYVSTTFLQT